MRLVLVTSGFWKRIKHDIFRVGVVAWCHGMDKKTFALLGWEAKVETRTVVAVSHVHVDLVLLVLLEPTGLDGLRPVGSSSTFSESRLKDEPPPGRIGMGQRL